MLAATSACALGATSGCVQRVRSILNRDAPTAASVTILTPPADDDQLATTLANEISSNLDRVGIDSGVEFLPRSELYREVLLNGDYEMFIGRLPPMTDPDMYRTLLYSVFAEEPGWQNPYRFTSMTLDDYLDDQRKHEGEERQQTVQNLIQMVANEQPFAVIGSATALRAVQDDRFTGWNRYEARSPLTYLALERARGVSEDEELTLEVTMVDSRATRNLNPLSVEFRDAGTFTRLLYDPLVYYTDEEGIPWLAEDIEWSTGSETFATVTLRPGLTWHDGESLTAEDISFTYRFFEDTSLGELDIEVPAPRFRGRTSLVEEATALDDRTIELSFGETSRDVAERALSVPTLPLHIWQEETGAADLSGFNSGDHMTDALVTSNDDAVGSGPLQLENMDSGEQLLFSRYDDHFLHRDPPESLPDNLVDGVAFDELEAIPVPSHDVSIEFLREREADATIANLSPSVAQTVEDGPDFDLLEADSVRPYHLGFNTAREPFSSPYFRRLVARLIDKSYLVEEVFHGYGKPVSNPFEGTVWNSDEFVYGDSDPEVPFLGTDGEVDVTEAQEAFRDHGYTFDEDGNLVFR